MATGKKRLNPEIGKPFKKGDVREDGYVFNNYSFTRIKADGYFVEVWSNPEKLEKRLAQRKLQDRYKRINPSTKKFFKMGDEIDGKTFRSFSTTLDEEGMYKLNLFSKEKHQQYKKVSIKRNKIDRDRAKRLGYKKRINPKTGNTWIKGEQNDIGKYFMGYETSADKEGWLRMRFGDYEKYKKRRLQNTFKNMKDRCLKNGITLEIDVDYMLEIFPKNNKCPILGIDFEFGGGLENLRTSPSLDRIKPEKGYVKGNVVFISYFANSIKQNATYQEILKVGNWLKKIESK